MRSGRGQLACRHPAHASLNIYQLSFIIYQFPIPYSGLGTPVAGQNLATDLKGGCSCLIRWDKTDSLLTALSGYYEPGGVSRLQGGVEAGFQKSYFLRAGYQLPLSDNQITGFSNFSAGAGIRFGRVTLDYAYLPYGNLGASQRISLTYDFLNPTPVPARPITVLAPPLPAKPVTVVVTAVPTPAPSVTPGPPKPNVQVHFVIPAIALTPDSGVGNFALEEKYEKATEANPNDAVAWRNLGLAYWNAGKTGLSLQCFEQALRLNPSDRELKTWLELYRAKHPPNP